MNEFAVGEASAGRKEKLRNWHLCVLTWHGPRRRRLPTDAPACNVAAPVSCILSASLGLCSRFCPLGFTGVLACICMSCETIDSGKHGNSIYLLDQKKADFVLQGWLWRSLLGLMKAMEQRR